MKVAMRIIGCEIKKVCDDNPDLSIYEVTLLPLSVYSSKKQGENILDKMGLGELAEMVKPLQDDNNEFFKARVPMAHNEWMDKGYSIGKDVMLELMPVC